MIAVNGQWDKLYPVPHPGAERNAGEASDPKPDAARLYFEQTGRKCPNFIYPPAAAVLLAPLALADHDTAGFAWTILGGLCVWGIGWIASAIYQLTQISAYPRQSLCISLMIHAMIVLLPRSLYELTHGNISPVIGLLLAAAMQALLRERPTLSMLFILLAACIKVTPICLIVLFFPRRFWPSWKGILSFAIAGVAILAITQISTWVEFARVIVPTLSRTWLPNHADDLSTASIHGMIGLWLPGSRLTPGWQWTIRISTFACLALLLVLFLRDRARLAAEPYRMLAFATGLVAWSMLFSPILWYHYFYYYLFCLPWLLANLRTSWLSMALSIVTLFFLFGPWGRVPPFSSSFYAARMMPGWIVLLLLLLSILNGISPRVQRAFTLGRRLPESQKPLMNPR